MSLVTYSFQVFLSKTSSSKFTIHNILHGKLLKIKNVNFVWKKCYDNKK